MPKLNCLDVFDVESPTNVYNLCILDLDSTPNGSSDNSELSPPIVFLGTTSDVYCIQQPFQKHEINPALSIRQLKLPNLPSTYKIFVIYINIS